MSEASVEPVRHSPVEDVLAVVTGTLIVAVALEMFRKAGIGTGGTAGLAFLVHYGSGLPLGLAVFLVNLPFYVFAFLRMGWVFTLKTAASVSLLAAEVAAMPLLLTLDRVDPVFAAAFGGTLVGVGLLILIRHKASLGGVGIVALYLQDRRGWSAGRVQMMLDTTILMGTVFVLDLVHVGLSVLGAATLNLVLATNHRAGRYLGS